jgi:hypothetical protein
LSPHLAAPSEITHRGAEQFDATTSLSDGPVCTQILGFVLLRRFHEAQVSIYRREKEPSMDPHERPVVTDDNKVAMRAGSTGNHVRYVLIASTALVIVCFIAIALFVKT